MQTLHRWGPLDLAELNSRLEVSFNAEPDSLKRNIQNDLKFLRDEGELVTYYYDKFGDFISMDLPPTGDAFYRMKWQTRENESYQISGLKELELFKGSLFLNPQAVPILEVRQGIGAQAPDKRLVYFELNHELYHLCISCPAKTSEKRKFLELGIGRTGSSSFKDHQWSTEIETAQVLLTLQDPYLSAIEAVEKPPIALSFFSDGAIDLTHNTNKNLPKSTEITEKQKQAILSDLTFFRDQTKTKHWTDTKALAADDGLKEGSRKNLMGPFILKIQDRSGFIVS